MSRFPHDFRNALARLIDERLHERGCSRADLIGRLGYGNRGKGATRLDRVLKTGDVSRFTRLNLARALELPESVVAAALTASERERAAARAADKARSTKESEETFLPYVYALTRREGIPAAHLVALCHDAFKVIRMPTELATKTLGQQVTTARRLIAKHLADFGGTVPVFGEIVGYALCRNPHSTIRFDVEGRVLNYFGGGPEKLKVEGTIFQRPRGEAAL